MKQEALIRKALDSAKAAGIRIGRGAMFDWTKPGGAGIPISSGDLPSECDATGAILLSMRWHLNDEWLKDFCNYLDIDTTWAFRFWQGWSQNKQLTLIIKKDDKEVEVKDDVSLLGRKLMREFVDGKI